MGVDDEPPYPDIVRDQGVLLQYIHRRPDRFLHGVEAAQPIVEVHIEIPAQVDRIVGYPAGPHGVQHARAVDVLGPAVRVAHDHHVLHSELVDPDQDAAHFRGERAADDPSGVLDYLGIPVLQSQCCKQELCETGVHAGDDRHLLVGILRGLVLLVSLPVDEPPIELQHVVYHRASHLAAESISSGVRESKESIRAVLNVPGPEQFCEAFSEATLRAVMAAATDWRVAPHAPA